MRNQPPTNLERLRERVAARVEASSLRIVARQVGMSPAGLQKFLSGGTPYAKSRKKLFDWWDRQRGHLPTRLSSPEIATAINALIQELPPERRSGAMEALVETLRGLYDRHADACPQWMAELVREPEAAADPFGDAPAPE
jgi:hypothetical protein